MISAKDLMIGDWVKLSKGNWSENRQVELTDIEMIVESVYLAEPIPLTAKILEKNGFGIQEQGGNRIDVWTGCGPDAEGDIEIEFDNGVPRHLKIDAAYKGEYYTSNNIHFIHELQHALRLCGIEKEIEIEIEL